MIERQERAFFSQKEKNCDSSDINHNLHYYFISRSSCKRNCEWFFHICNLIFLTKLSFLIRTAPFLNVTLLNALHEKSFTRQFNFKFNLRFTNLYRRIFSWCHFRRHPSFFLVVTHASKIKMSNQLSVCEAAAQSPFCRLAASYPRYPREAKVTLTITRAPREGNDSGEGAKKGGTGSRPRMASNGDI